MNSFFVEFEASERARQWKAEADQTRLLPRPKSRPKVRWVTVGLAVVVALVLSSAFWA